MNINVGLNVKGNYNVKLIDSITGSTKQEGNFHNIGCIGIAKILSASNTNTGYGLANYILVGKGTSVPKYTDTGLTSQLWKIGASSRSWEWKDYYTIINTCKYIFPATSSYVGTATELGLCSDSILTTHALLTDSEGNIISFNKTDLDILEINVKLEIGFTNNNNNFNIFKYPFLLKALNTTYIFNSRVENFYGMFSLFRYIYDTKNFEAIRDGDIGYSSNYAATREICGYSLGKYIENKVSSSYNPCYFRMNKQRIANTEITTENYYSGVGCHAVGAITFPNETKFPTYTISNINIGTGDGENTTFNNPLAYFKKDTDVIKINGEALTRNVDYTINHIGNHSKWLSVCQFDELPEVIYDIKHDDETWTGCNTRVAPMFIPSAASQKVINRMSDICFGINADNPAILKYNQSKSFNFLKGCNIKLLRKNGSGAYSTATTTATIYLDKSDDGESFDEVISTVISSNSINVDFETTSAKYWRIRTNQVASDSNYDYIVAIYPSSDTVYTEDCGIVLGLCDPYIEFTNPPSDEDVITMDVGMDVIMKNGNYAIDITTQIDFSIT